MATNTYRMAMFAKRRTELFRRSEADKALNMSKDTASATLSRLAEQGIVRKIGESDREVMWQYIPGAKITKDSRGKHKNMYVFTKADVAKGVSNSLLKRCGKTLQPRPFKTTALEQALGWGCER